MKRRSFVGLLAGALSAGCAPAMSTPWMRMQRRGFAYLASRQSADGAWRSEVYGAFKSGHGLTPLVAHAGWRGLSPAKQEATVSWLLEQGRKSWELFPVHNAGWLLSLAREEKRLARLVPALVDCLCGLQFNAERSWTADDPHFGGWSYAGTPPVMRGERPLAAMEEPNLSATVLAVSGLRRAGVGADDARLQQAGRFISRCQNFRPVGGGRFDDGGFFQMVGDATRNKAGVIGVDRDGHQRFRSYYSATADGIRGLMMAGVKASDPRIRAALKWMAAHPLINDVPDLTFYANFARAQAEEWLDENRSLPGEFPDENALRQESDGSWHNPAGEMRENDPLVATSLKLMANHPRRSEITRITRSKS